MSGFSFVGLQISRRQGDTWLPVFEHLTIPVLSARTTVVVGINRLDVLAALIAGRLPAEQWQVVTPEGRRLPGNQPLPGWAVLPTGPITLEQVEGLPAADFVAVHEPTLGLGVLAAREVLDTLVAVQGGRGFGLLILTSDIRIAAAAADDVVVMVAGRVGEIGSVQDIFYRPRLPFTRALLDSALKFGDHAGEPILPSHLGDTACAFADHCPNAVAANGSPCRQVAPPRHLIRPGHEVFCHAPLTREVGNG